MNIIIKYIDIIKKILKKIKKSFELNMYDDFTIADFFRKQGAIIGEHNRIEIRSLGSEPYLIKIGDHCTVAPGVCFITHDGGTWNFTNEIASLQNFGQIEISDNCFIGQNVIILPNIKIGPNSIIGAGSVVTKNIPPNSIAVGNPARIISNIDEYKKKVISRWRYQKPIDYFIGIDDNKHYTPEYINKIKERDSEILKKHLLKIFKN